MCQCFNSVTMFDSSTSVIPPHSRPSLSSWYPLLQLHWNEPMVLLQTWAQPPLFLSHSSISVYAIIINIDSSLNYIVGYSIYHNTYAGSSNICQGWLCAFWKALKFIANVANALIATNQVVAHMDTASIVYQTFIHICRDKQQVVKVANRISKLI